MARWPHLLLVAALGGCSLIYNPDNLPGKDASDAPVDVEIILDADPTMLAISRVSPAVIYEGDGVDGSRASVLVIHGTQIASGATVTLTEHGTGAVVGSVTVDNANAGVSANGFELAVPVTAAIDPNQAAIPLDVAVTQDSAAGMVTRTLPADLADPAQLILQGLPELDNGAPVLAPGDHEYSRINVVSVGLTQGATSALQLHARASITISGAVAANARGQLAGPGGANGPSGAPKLAIAAVGNGPGGGQPSGGGGGYGTAGNMGTTGAGGAIAGDDAISSFGANKGSSGAGGNGGPSSSGGSGGGGGGTISIVAGGTVTITAIQAKGGDGANPTSLGHGDPGGGGSGGTVLVRGGNTVAVTSVEVPGGVGKNGGTVGQGGFGRVRFDAPNADVGAELNGATGYRGPMFAVDTPLITRDEKLPLTVTGEATKSVQYMLTNESGSATRGPFTVSIDAGPRTFPLAAPLFRGLNQVCLLVGTATLPAADEAKNCIWIAYLYTP